MGIIPPQLPIKSPAHLLTTTLLNSIKNEWKVKSIKKHKQNIHQGDYRLIDVFIYVKKKHKYIYIVEELH